METGQINVQTENIFPIIKKFLYSDHEIFLRELIANAIDATQKLKKLSSMGEIKGDLGDTQIEIKIDEKAKTLTISDKGIGMTADEVKKYINQIAFSSAQDFLDKFKDEKDTASIIGKFGLGFYSGFMVSEKVEIITKSYKKGKAAKWSCDGSPDYTLEETKKKERGTDIILYINEESKEFLEKIRIQTLLDKYCKFLPVEIKFDDKVINNANPAWTKKPADLTTEDYQNFYKELYPFSETPLFWIHLNVDFPFNLTGILYFPKLKGGYEMQKSKIQLYSRQVFVTDSVEEIVPEFLMHLHGVIDSPDIPLNVSRSYLQSDVSVKKINSYITKKVADKLADLFKNDRKEFEEKWEHFSVFVKYGMISDEKFYEKAKDFCLLQNTKDEYFTIEEYKEKIKANQTGKDENIVALYTNGKEAQDNFIQPAIARGYDVLVFDSIIDSHFFSQLESKLEKVNFKRVDADPVDSLIEENETKDSVLSKKEEEKLTKLFTDQINNPMVTVILKPMSPKDQPAIVTKPEFSRRMQDMAAAGGMGDPSMIPEQINLVLNTNHPLTNKVLTSKSKKEKEAVVHHLYDLALLSQNMLKGTKLTNFVKRSVEMIG